MPPAISVIITSYNYARFIEENMPNQCCICGAIDAKLLFFSQQFPIVACKVCGLARTAGVHYDGTFYNTQPSVEYAEDCLARRNELHSSFQRGIEFLEQFQRPGKLLDVGCGIGLLLDIARDRGWEVEGVEVSEYAVDLARRTFNLPVHLGTLAQAALPEQCYDAIVFNHVLEHLPSPLQELQEAYRLLRWDGFLYVGVPNFGSPLARISRGRWSSLQPDGHLWHFTLRTLSRLLDNAGFQIVGYRSENHQIVSKRPKALIYRTIGWWALRQNAGEGMQVIARKKNRLNEGNQPS